VTSSSRPLGRILLAAVRLAALYGAGVTILFLALILLPAFTQSIPPSVGEAMAVISAPFLTLFPLSFLLLAITRRFGFGIMWALLAAFWVLMLRAGYGTTLIIVAFLVWSILAAPLYVMVAAGVPRSGQAAPRSRLWARLGVLAWLVLALSGELVFASKAFFSGRPASAGMQLLLHVWVIAPFVIVATAFSRLRPLFRRSPEAAA